MPYKREGERIYSKASGSWKLKQKCDSIEKAKSAMKFLHGLEHGMKPKKKASK